jgi:hypothetical protein
MLFSAAPAVVPPTDEEISHAAPSVSPVRASAPGSTVGVAEDAAAAALATPAALIALAAAAT